MADLEHLRSFAAAYRTGSLTAAAERLRLSQPAVTAHVKSLEAGVGHKLFVRVARGVEPTPHGRLLARELLPHLDAVEAILTQHSSRGSLEGTVQLGGPADLVSMKALPALVPLTEAGLRLGVRMGIAEPLLAELAAGGLDVVVATRRTAQLDVRFEPLFEEELVLVGPPALASDLRPETIEAAGARALAGQRLVAFDADLPIIRRYFDDVFGEPPTAGAWVTLPDLRGVRDAVAAGAGISVLPRYVVAGALAAGALVELHRPSRRPSNTIFVATRTGALDHRTGAVVAALQAAARGWAQD